MGFLEQKRRESYLKALGKREDDLYEFANEGDFEEPNAEEPEDCDQKERKGSKYKNIGRFKTQIKDSANKERFFKSLTRWERIESVSKTPLRNYNNWVLSVSGVPGSGAKVPFSVYHQDHPIEGIVYRRSKVNNPSDTCSFETAKATMLRNNIKVMFYDKESECLLLAEVDHFSTFFFVLKRKDNIVGVDIDGCVDENGVIDSRAKDLCEFFDTYTEYSLSGNGIRMFMKGGLINLPDQATGKSSVDFEGLRIEIYRERRNLSVTGLNIPGFEKGQLAERQDKLDFFCENYFEKQKERKTEFDVATLSDGGGLRSYLGADIARFIHGQAKKFNGWFEDYKEIEHAAEFERIQDRKFSADKAHAETVSYSKHLDNSPIKDGNRNSQMFSIACSLIKKKNIVDVCDLERELKDINDERCDPPLDDHEIQNIARSAFRYV